MSAQPIENTVHSPGTDEDGGHFRGPDHDTTAPPAQVEVRRNAAVSAVIGAAAAAIAIAYLGRAVGSGAFLDWVLCLVLGVMAVGFLRSLLDSRTPLLVVDELGVRIRLGGEWRGLPWEAIDRVVVRPPGGLLRDGRLSISLHHLQRSIEGLEGRARRHARLNQRMYGAVLAVPLGMTTRVSGGRGEDLAGRVTSLSQGRTEVVTLLEEPTAPSSTVPTLDESSVENHERPVITDDESGPMADRRPRWMRRSQDAATLDRATSGTVSSGLEPELGIEGGSAEEGPAENGSGEPVTTLPFTVVDAVSPVGRSSRVRAIAKLGDPVAPLVIEEFHPEPAYDPVIGPELAAARTRVGLSVDELADRTRIRPHVIESIEVDDFRPCGGDFYARGHIRTLARVLGKDPAPILAHFDARYATAPINARKVFEAELATGLTGSMRSTVGGPNWALLIGVVLTLILVWSGVRLFAGDSQEVLENPPPVLNGSAGLGNVYGEQQPSAPPPVATTLSAVNAGAHLEVRDGDGALVFEGDLVIGEVKRLEVEPPITVTSDNGGAVSVVLGTRDLGFLGEPDQPATQVFQRPTG